MQRKAQPNFYLILNVSPKASKKDIKLAYLRLVKIYHSDKNKGNRLAEKKFQQINQAWEILKDDKKRQTFDESLKAKKLQRPQFQNKEKLDCLNKNLKSPVKRKEKPIDLELTLRVSLEDVCQSRSKKVHYLKPVDGKKIKSSFAVQIPWGAKDGSRLKFKGEGGAEGKKVFGDLYIKLQFKIHKIFHLTEDFGDLLLEQPISFVSAVQGQKLQVPSPYGFLALNLSPPVKDKQVLKLKGQGLIKSSKGEKGDLFVKIRVDYPTENRIKIQKQIEQMSFEKQKIYVEKFKNAGLIYPKVLKFQKKVQELKREQ